MNIKFLTRLFPLFFFTLISCSHTKDCCTCIEKNEVIIDQLVVKEIKAYIIRRDSGAFGYSGSLRICNLKDSLKEEIGLRAEDYLPKIDSIIGNNVYIHYSFPRDNKSTQIEKLNFESVVLGEALLDKSKLKYSYHFYNHN